MLNVVTTNLIDKFCILLHGQLFVLDSLKKIANFVSSFLNSKLDGRKNQIRKRNMQDKSVSVKKKRSDMKQVGDEMKLSETCTFSLKFQTQVETQESLITHGIRILRFLEF